MTVLSRQGLGPTLLSAGQKGACTFPLLPSSPLASSPKCSSLRVSELALNRLQTTTYAQAPIQTKTSTWPLVVTGVMDPYTRPCCCKAKDPVMALVVAWAGISPWPLVAAQASSYQAVSHKNYLSSSTSLHSAQTIQLLFSLSAFTTYLLMVVMPTSHTPSS